jgi:hypothetical protein
MKEEEAGMRHLGPLVKADLANLDADAESRRIALKSLKQFVEQLDTASMSRFLTQVKTSFRIGLIGILVLKKLSDEPTSHLPRFLVLFIRCPHHEMWSELAPKVLEWKFPNSLQDVQISLLNPKLSASVFTLHP